MQKWPQWLGWSIAGLLIAQIAFTEGLQTHALEAAQDALGVGRNVARVMDAQWPSVQVPPDFILIEDVHRHPQVQSQIASLIVHGYYAWGVKKVFLEGAFTSLDLSIFHRVPNKARSLLMERLVKEGDLSGPELAAVLILEREWRNPPISPFQLFGMENPRLYRKNVHAYEAVVAQRGRALEQLVSIRRLQDSMHLPEPNLLHEQLDRVEDLLRLKLTPEEYAVYLKSKEAAPSTPILDPAIRAAEQYYQLAELRTQVFLNEACKKVPASTAPRILVMGGFHTPTMAKLLRQEGRTFVVLSPSVSYGEQTPIYDKRMKETANVLAEALIPASH